MFKSLTVAALLGVAAFAAPATAATTYDAFSSFNGTQGAGGFSYGSFTGGTFTPFSATANCESIISGTTCINDGYLPGAFKTTIGAHQSGSVIVPDDRLILHPGQNDNASYIMFTAPTAGTYDLSAFFSVQDTNPSGVDISFYYLSGGQVQLTLPVTSLNAANPTFSISPIRGTVAAGDSVAFVIDKGATFFNDSTGVGLTISAVPEPATWSLLIGGFAMTGVAMRRRKVALTA